jgi:hypothetical protein
MRPVAEDVSDFAGRKCAEFLAATCPTKPEGTFKPLQIKSAKSEAVTQESLGRSPRKSDPRKSIALKARFNPAGETPYGSRLVTRFQR